MLTTFSCKKGDSIIDDLNCTVTAVHGKKDNIIGKWKLVAGRQVGIDKMRIEDYSCQNIIYEFRSDGNLIVTGDAENYLGISQGTHEFKLTSKPVYEWLEEKQTLRIGGDRDWACGISQYKMTLNDSPLDGPKLTLYRIQ
jgi:hypothetical protein